MADERLYILDGGDGRIDFTRPIHMHRTSTSWFHGHIGDQEAILFNVTDGKYRGDYIALTSRTLARLEDQMESYGVASVVVHKINNPTVSFNATSEDSDPVGMSFVEIVGWKRNGPIRREDWPTIPQPKSH